MRQELITKLIDEPYKMAHYRILVVEDNEEIYHDSASSLESAKKRLLEFNKKEGRKNAEEM
jgi:hypothetical protein